MADDGQVERFVVVSACGEHRPIAQFRCFGLTGTDIHVYIYTNIHTYIHTYIQTGDDNASRLLASPFGSAIIQHQITSFKSFSTEFSAVYTNSLLLIFYQYYCLITIH